MLKDVVFIIFLVILSGTYAGLTLALFSIKLTTLERKIRLGDQQAERVYEIRKKGNLLLCSLLLGNVASYTAMTIFLSNITNSVLAGFVATSLIFVFGEILPQAVFPRYALQMSARFLWMVRISIILFYPVAAPIAWVLDRLLGQEPPVLWNKKELGEIIKYHEDVGDGIIDKDEERIILGALSFSELTVSNIMIPRHEVYYLPGGTIIDKTILQSIREKGFSRIPVYDKEFHKISGIIYTKDLIGITPEQQITTNHITNKENLIIVKQETRLDNVLNEMVSHKVHMAIAIDRNGHFSGIVTMEDVIEEILNTELEENKH